MGYKASENIDPLDYDFAPFCPEIKGVTPEFEFDSIKAYWNGYQNMLRRHADALNEWMNRRQALGDTPDKDALDSFEADYEKWQDETADNRIETRRRLLAMLCSDQPSYEELCKLPGRVFDDFEREMQAALTPKDSRPVST